MFRLEPRGHIGGAHEGAALLMSQGLGSLPREELQDGPGAAPLDDPCKICEPREMPVRRGSEPESGAESVAPGDARDLDHNEAHAPGCPGVVVAQALVGDPSPLVTHGDVGRREGHTIRQAYAAQSDGVKEGAVFGTH